MRRSRSPVVHRTASFQFPGLPACGLHFVWLAVETRPRCAVNLPSLIPYKPWGWALQYTSKQKPNCSDISAIAQSWRRWTYKLKLFLSCCLVTKSYLSKMFKIGKSRPAYVKYLYNRFTGPQPSFRNNGDNKIIFILYLEKGSCQSNPEPLLSVSSKLCSDRRFLAIDISSQYLALAVSSKFIHFMFLCCLMFIHSKFWDRSRQLKSLFWWIKP